MLQIILDCDTRLQVQRLVQWLQRGQADPFVADTLIVGDLGTGIWLQQQIAQVSGISTNLKLELPGRYIWSGVQQHLRGTESKGSFDVQAPYEPLVARWAIYQILATSVSPQADNPELEPLFRAWRQASDRDRILLSTELARQFERYLTYRRAWLDAWAKGARPAHAMATRGRGGAAVDATRLHEPWQAWLWQQLVGRIEGFSAQHPFDQFQEQIKTNQPVSESEGRLAIFGQIGLSGEQLRLLSLLARSRPAIWFAHDPSQGFWEGLLSPRQAAKMAEADPQLAWMYEDEPAVLGEWGRQCRDALIQVRELEQDGLASINDDSLRERSIEPAASNLARLQAAVFELSDAPWTDAQPLQIDPSLEVHSAHSLARQADIACDRVLEALAQLPGLRPADIVVFCADLDTTAPLVRSAFEHPEIGLPVQISGASIRVGPKVRALEGFMRLVQGPAHVNAVLDWLEGPAQRAGAGLTTEVLAQLRQLLAAAGLHRDDIGGESGNGELNHADSLLATGDNTAGDQAHCSDHGWRQGIDRLILGALIGTPTAQDSLALGVLPVGELSVTQAEALGQVARLLDLIATWRGVPGQLRPVRAWSQLMLRFVNDWLASSGENQAELLRIRDALSQLHDAVASLPDAEPLLISFASFSQALSAHLEQGSPVARASGAITVAPLGALREVPFRVCVMLGMDEGEFPPRQRPSESDLMSLLPVFGDANPAAVGRGWFLQTLLNTEDRLVFAYQGRDSRGDSPLNPSRLIAELLGYLGRFKWIAPAALTTMHPLQPFSPRRFAPEAPVPSYARHWYDAALALANGADDGVGYGPVAVRSTSPSKPSKSSDSPEVLTIDGQAGYWRAEELARTLLDPARAFLQQTGSIALLRYERTLSDIEPLGLHDYKTYQLFEWKRQVARWLAIGWPEDQIRARLSLEPTMPAGVAIEPVLRAVLGEGERIWQAEQAALLSYLINPEQLSAVLASGVTGQFARVAVKVEGAAPIVSGQTGIVMNSGAGGQVQWLTPARALNMDAVLHTWITHLLVCSLTPANQPISTVRLVVGDSSADQKPAIVFNRQSLRMHDGLCLDSLPAWQRLLVSADQACREPMALFPRTAAAWLSKAEVGEPIESPQDNDAAFSQARLVFEGADNGRVMPEINRPWANALWRGHAPELALALEHSLALYAPIWWSMQGLLEGGRR